MTQKSKKLIFLLAFVGISAIVFAYLAFTQASPQSITIISPTDGQIFTQDNPTAIFNITTNGSMDECRWVEQGGKVNYTLEANDSHTGFSLINTTMVDGRHTGIFFSCNQSSDGAWKNSTAFDFYVDSKNITDCRDLSVSNRTYTVINDINFHWTNSHNCLYVYMPNITVDCQWNSINSSVYGVDIENTGNTTIKNCRINTSLIGVWLEQGNVDLYDSQIYNSNASSWDVYQKTGVGVAANFINVTYLANNAHESFSSASSKFSRKWYLYAQINNTLKQPLPGATVAGYDSSWVGQDSASTDSNGQITPLKLTEYQISGGTTTYKTPHNLNVSLSKYNTNSTKVNMSVSKNGIHSVLLVPEISLSILSPLSQVYSSNVSLSLNLSVENQTAINRCWYYILNSTNGYEISNTTLTNCQNTTFNISREGVYNMYAFINSTSGESNYDSVTFEISLSAPAIVLNYPSNDSYLNANTNYLNFTATDSNGLSTCQLWGNWTGWSKNYSWFSPTNNSMNWTSITINDGYYFWNVWCNDSLGNGRFALANLTFAIDTIYPEISIDTITTTAGSQTIQFTNNITEKNPSSCKYSVYNSSGGIDGLNSNVSFSCGASTSATVSAYGSYTLWIYLKDKAGWENSTSLAFATSASSSVVILNGGGGGAPIIVNGTGQWKMSTDSDSSQYTLSMPLGGVRTKTLQFQNLGSTNLTLALTCEGELCQYLNLSQTSVQLPVGIGFLTEVPFTITLPANLSKDSYDAIIYARQGTNEASVRVIVTIGGTGFLVDFFSKFFDSTLIYGIKVPYFAIFIIIGAMVFLLGLLIAGMGLKLPLSRETSIILGVIAGIIAVAVL